MTKKPLHNSQQSFLPIKSSVTRVIFDRLKKYKHILFIRAFYVNFIP